MRTEAIPGASGWRYSIDEVSAGVYRIRAEDDLGRTFEASGFDPDALLQRAREYALELRRPKVPEL